MILEDLPDWERLLAAERHLQALVPGTVLVGGAALQAGHGKSQDDQVLEDLRPQFDDVLVRLESAAGWQTSPGVRQLRRTRPLETELVAGLTVPTLAEMARIKAWLLVTRSTVRDYLDTVVLLELLGEGPAREAFASFDTIYAQPAASPPLVEVVERLAAASPTDASTVDLATYKGLVPPWDDWSHLAARGRHWAGVLAAAQLA